VGRPQGEQGLDAVIGGIFALSTAAWRARSWWGECADAVGEVQEDRGKGADGTLQRADYVSKRGFMIHGEPWSDTVHLTFDCHEKVVESHTEHFQADHAPHPPKR